MQSLPMSYPTSGGFCTETGARVAWARTQRRTMDLENKFVAAWSCGPSYWITAVCTLLHSTPALPLRGLRPGGRGCCILERSVRKSSRFHTFVYTRLCSRSLQLGSTNSASLTPFPGCAVLPCDPSTFLKFILQTSSYLRTRKK
jgi:hypothetical protein